MLSKLKKKSILKYFEKEVNVAASKTRNLNDRRIKTIGVLIEESHLMTSNNTLNSLQQNFEIPIENIELLVFKKFHKKEEYTDFECSEKAFGWYGSLKLNKLQEFVKNEYDLLINYGFEENLYWNVITLQSQSHFKVGFATKIDGLYDLSISDETRDLDVLTSEMVKYLKILKKI